MVEISIKYMGDLRCEATHGPSGTVLVTDAPVDNEGRGESFSPTDIAATSLGSCMLTIMGIVARRHEIDLGATTVKVGKIMLFLRFRFRRITRKENFSKMPPAVARFTSACTRTLCRK